MEHIESAAPMTVEQRYGGTIVMAASLLNPVTQVTQSFIAVTSQTQHKTILLLDGKPIEFDTLWGKQAWVDSFGILKGTSLILIDDGSTQSLWIHSLDWSQSTLTLDSSSGASETIYRIRKDALSKTGIDNNFFWNANITSLANPRWH